jgi:hypothetical protein
LRVRRVAERRGRGWRGFHRCCMGLHLGLRRPSRGMGMPGRAPGSPGVFASSSCRPSSETEIAADQAQHHRWRQATRVVTRRDEPAVIS